MPSVICPSVTCRPPAGSWQVADSSTVLHIDDFEGGRSLAFFHDTDGQLFRPEGSLKPVKFVHKD